MNKYEEDLRALRQELGLSARGTKYLIIRLLRAYANIEDSKISLEENIFKASWGVANEDTPK